MSIEVNRQHVFGTRLLPGVAIAQPVIRLLHLPAPTDFLVEDPKLIADPIAVGGKAQSCHGVQEASWISEEEDGGQQDGTDKNKRHR